MTLQEWMAKRNLSSADVATMLTKEIPNARIVQAAHIRQYIDGSKQPSWERMHQISVITGGKVMPNDWVKEAMQRQGIAA